MNEWKQGAVVFALLLLAAACGGPSPEPPKTAEPKSAQPKAETGELAKAEPPQKADEKKAMEEKRSEPLPEAGEGAIAGKVIFQGEPPRARPIAMDAEPVCAAKHSGPVLPELVVVNPNGTLRNVFVHLKSGLGGKTFPVPKEQVTLDQEGCVYKPHVVAIRAKQELRIVSSDPTSHNVHPLPQKNKEWNVSQTPGSGPIIQTFVTPEISIPVICNLHPWMRAYVHVVAHPFFSITGDTGTFEWKGVPSGEYQVEAIQERYGAVTRTVTVERDKTANVDFTFQADQAYAPGSFRMMPALVIR